MLRRLRLEIRLLLAGRSAIVAAAVLLLGGLFAIWHGDHVIGRQVTTLAASAQQQATEHRRILGPLDAGANAGDQLYYLGYHTSRHPSPWAPIAIGQRDVQAFNLKVRLLALHGQLYDADLVNPLLASLGNFDLAFVLVVAMPLIIIALTFNLYSSEVESGVWTMVRAQPVRAAAVLCLRYLLRAGVVGASAGALLIVAALGLNLSFDRAWWLVAGVTLGYVLLWTAVAAAVAALKRSSDVNVLILLGIWIVWTVLGPALLNVSAARSFPLPESLELTVRQRQGYHGAWDRPLPEVMEAFYQRYPEWRTVTLPRDRYSNGWYYAMQQRGDDAAESAARRYRAGLEAREAWLAGASSWLPPLAFHRFLTGVARTDLAAYLRYLDSVAAYHESLKRHFFPVVFSDATVGDVDWTAAPQHQHRD